MFKSIILICLIWGIFAWIARNLGMYIYDEEYASYKQTLDYISHETNEQNDVLIFGDSVAKAAVIPQILSENAYNISMAGATTIEQYYILQDYLEHHEPPKALIMMYFIGAYDSIEDFFWNRTIYFNCLKTNQFREIVENGAFSEEEKTQNIMKFWQYKLCSPNKYYAAIKNAMFENRYEINQKEYEIAQKSKGQHYFGTEPAFEPNNVTITGKQQFQPLAVIDTYLHKCIQLCQENNIQVILEQHPINASTYANMNQDYKQQYTDYMKNLAEQYPEIVVNIEYNVCESDWLGDFSHLNEKGATQFSKELKEKYEVFWK